jgi:hypothetical protein
MEEKGKMATTVKTGQRTRLFKALSHELRAEVLTYLIEHGKSSPKEMAECLAGTTTDIDYHAKQLVSYGCAELVEEKPRRGATEHFYIATMRPLLEIEDCEKMSKRERADFSAVIADRMLADIELGFASDTIDARVERHMSRMPMLLDEAGWLDALAIVDSALERLFDVQAESDERRQESGDPGTRVSAMLACFTLPG